MTSEFAQRAITVTDFIGNVATEAARAGGTAQEVANFVNCVSFFGRLAAGFIPGLSSVIQVLDVALPTIQKIAAAAPILHRVIEQGDTLVSAADKSGLLENAKQLYALAVNADPARPETDLSPDEVPASQAMNYVGGLFERSFFSPQDPRFAGQTFG